MNRRCDGGCPVEQPAARLQRGRAEPRDRQAGAVGQHEDGGPIPRPRNLTRNRSAQRHQDARKGSSPRGRDEPGDEGVSHLDQIYWLIARRRRTRPPGSVVVVVQHGDGFEGPEDQAPPELIIAFLPRNLPGRTSSRQKPRQPRVSRMLRAVVSHVAATQRVVERESVPRHRVKIAKIDAESPAKPPSGETGMNAVTVTERNQRTGTDAGCEDRDRFSTSAAAGRDRRVAKVKRRQDRAAEHPPRATWTAFKRSGSPDRWRR